MPFPIFRILAHKLGHHREYGQRIQWYLRIPQCQLWRHINIVCRCFGQLRDRVGRSREFGERAVGGIEGKSAGNWNRNINLKGSIEVWVKPARPLGSNIEPLWSSGDPRVLLEVLSAERLPRWGNIRPKASLTTYRARAFDLEANEICGLCRSGKVDVLAEYIRSSSIGQG